MAKPNKNTTIQHDLFNQGQSWNLVQVVETVTGQKLRVRIRRNAYDEQSYGLAELWNGQEWSEVIQRPIMSLKCKSACYTDQCPNTKLFDEDANDLLAKALKVCAK
jgi:hypothetical protein